MTPTSHPFRWLPPFLVGVCAATAAEVAVGLLLYGGPGLMRSLTTVLAVEAAALGLGFMTAPPARPDLLDALRRRWLFALGVFLLATLFSAFWSVVELVGGSALGQGLGLGLLAALPLYAAGGLLGAMGSALGSDASVRPGAVGGPAALGAALGFAATGASLPQVFTPASLLLVCLVLLSAGGLVYGSILDSQIRVHVRARRPSPLGDVRVEDRHLLARDLSVRILAEGEHIRRWSSLAEDAPEGWDARAVRSLGEASGCTDGDVLMIGGGASPLARALVREHATRRVDVAERSGHVLELGREHLDTGLDPSGDGRLGVRVGSAEDVLDGLPGPYAVVVMDTSALAPLGGVEGLSRRVKAAVEARVGVGGFLVLGPRPGRTGGWSFPEGWSRARYLRSPGGGLGALGDGVGEDEVVDAASPRTDFPWPDALGDFARVPEPGEPA